MPTGDDMQVAVAELKSKEKPKKVLIVDDVPEIGELVKLILERHGFDVYVARNANEGFEKVREVSPDLILMDIFLPGMSGVDATKKLREEDGFKKPIILFSVLSEIEGIAEETKRSGADDYITKPFEIDEFVQKVKKYLNEDTD